VSPSADRRPLRPYFGAFLGLGVALSFFGPALPTLRDTTGSTLDQIGLVFAAQSVGGLVGAVVAGTLYRRLGGPHLIALAVLLMAGALGAVALAGTLGAVIVLGALIGLGAGTTDVAANSVVPTVVAPSRVTSSMNVLHLCFALGAVATPLLVGVSVAVGDGLGLVCAIATVSLVPVAVVLWRRHGAAGARAAIEQHAASGPGPAAWRLGVVAVFYVLYVGLEVGFAGWVATYVVELDLGRDWATVATTGFWAGFLLGRLVMAGVGDRLPTERVLWLSTAAACVVALALGLLGGSGAAGIAVLSVVFGAAIAPQFPTMLAHLHRAVPLTGPVTAWCIVGSSIGGLLIPPLLGVIMEEVGPAALPWSLAVIAAGCVVALAAVERALPVERDPAAPVTLGP
jgi:FHS family Na+ dependent glucose MFS transporter 1